MTEHHRLAAVTEAVTQGAPATRVLYLAEDDRFLLLDADAPEDGEQFEGELAVICLDCLIEHHPEAARGMDVAKANGEAWLEDGAWIEAA